MPREWAESRDRFAGAGAGAGAGNRFDCASAGREIASDKPDANSRPNARFDTVANRDFKPDVAAAGPEFKGRSSFRVPRQAEVSCSICRGSSISESVRIPSGPTPRTRIRPPHLTKWIETRGSSVRLPSSSSASSGNRDGPRNPCFFRIRPTRNKAPTINPRETAVLTRGLMEETALPRCSGFDCEV